ncbi:hypothetical protein CCACVL1_08784 [Corchorus capsularis]|uniref:Uncharacterized protein n=1 Tax=Corchorus capsularis TaxID=210143 RepID=A0A1R3IYU1_COCAP|nr:hypothetical protein CCACVL1_08784 [Corchorus capsularis]
MDVVSVNSISTLTNDGEFQLLKDLTVGKSVILLHHVPIAAGKQGQEDISLLNAPCEPDGTKMSSPLNSSSNVYIEDTFIPTGDDLVAVRREASEVDDVDIDKPVHTTQ